MKHMQTSKGLLVPVIVLGGIGLGVGGYFLGTHKQNVQQPKTEKVAKVSSSSKHSKKVEVVEDKTSEEVVDNTPIQETSSSTTQQETNTEKNTTNATPKTGTKQIFDPTTQTFAGYSNIHEFWNNYLGHSVISYLENVCGYSEEQAMAYISNYANQGLDKFMGSGDIQDYNNYAREHGGTQL